MTAIAGLIRLDDAPIDRATLERMQSVLAPYGPDAQQHWQQGSAGFVRTLLRTTPEDSLDHQPLHDSASQTLLMFDGRIDNRDELARQLGLAPAELALMADSALALQACLRWGQDAVEHLLGDFALACWHPLQRKLWLARDPIGHRPLYWHRQDGFFAFASLPKALFAVPGVPRALCEERLHDYLCLLPMVGPESFFKDVYRVEPGELLTLENGRVSTRRYHQFDPARELRFASDDDYLEGFREQLDRAVACRLRSIGGIASHLSSGFDSSTVTAVAGRLLAAQGRGLLAYTAVPREGYEGAVPRGRHADEGPGARALAARFANIEHILIRSGGTSPLQNLEANVEALDRAPLNPCNMVWGDAIQADAARRGAKVLLTGQMGNMTISYTGEQRLPALLGQGQWLEWWRQASALKRQQPGRRWRGLLAQSIGPYLPGAAWSGLQRWRARGQTLTDYSPIHPDFIGRMDSARRARRAGWDLSYRPWADGRRMRIAVLNRLDNGDYFAAANAQGLDMRDPTADLRLIEYCLAVPDRQYLHDGQTRRLLHRLMGDVLPPEILQAKSQGLQAADWHEGAGADLAALRDQIKRLREHGSAAGYLDLQAMEHALDEWPTENWHGHTASQSLRLRLLRGLSVGTFIRYVDSRNR